MRQPLYNKTAALILGGIVCAIPLESHACVICLHKNLWNLFPPIEHWSLIGVVWFLVYSLMTSMWNQKNSGIPSIIGGIILLFAAVIAWAAFLSYIALVPFLFVSIGAWLKSWTSDAKSEDSSFYSIARIVGTIAAILLVTTAVSDYRQYSKMTPADFVIKDRTSDARSLISKLKKEEPASIGEYRKIISQAGYQTSGYILVANRLSIIGEPQSDMPLLLDALARMEQAGAASYYRNDIQKPLQTLSGLAPPEKTSSAEWRKVWNDKTIKP